MVNLMSFKTKLCSKFGNTTLKFATVASNAKKSSEGRTLAVSAIRTQYKISVEGKGGSTVKNS